MLRCYWCRGHATAGLAHLHGLPIPLCKSCTDKELERQAAQRASGALRPLVFRERVQNPVKERRAA